MSDPVDPAENVAAVTTQVLDHLARGDDPPPTAIALLIRQYAATGRPAVRDALESALAGALSQAGEDIGGDRQQEWVAVLAEASLLSDDPRLRDQVGAAAAALATSWPRRGGVAAAMRSIGDCLAAAAVVSDRTLVPRAIDELERIISASYEPGNGLTRVIGSSGEQPGELADHLAAASALLMAFEVTGRLPYPMLAEELIQYCRRTWWDEAAGVFQGSFAENCEAARALCRLAALHGDHEYRAAAVVSSCDYAAEAGRILARLSSQWQQQGLDAAQYAIALDDLAAYDKIHRRL